MALNLPTPPLYEIFSLLNLNLPRFESVFCLAKSRLPTKFKPIKLASDLIRVGAIYKLGARTKPRAKSKARKKRSNALHSSPFIFCKSSLKSSALLGFCAMNAGSKLGTKLMPPSLKTEPCNTSMPARSPFRSTILQQSSPKQSTTLGFKILISSVR